MKPINVDMEIIQQRKIEKEKTIGTALKKRGNSFRKDYYPNRIKSVESSVQTIHWRVQKIKRKKIFHYRRYQTSVKVTRLLII